MNILGYPLGLIMRLLYNILHSYGWALILFTLLVRLVLVPLSVKQQKSSAKMAAIQPQMQEIQKMYAKNQTKMNEELQKLYQREKYNPAGGCLPMLITLLVLFGLIDVIYNPMQHILGISSDVITQATEIMKGLGVAFSRYSPQTAIISSVQANPEAYAALGNDFVSAVQSFDLNFFGINLGETPSLSLTPLVLIPILSGITAFVPSWLTIRNNPAAMEGPGASSMKVMMWGMNIMFVFMCFQMPVGFSLYYGTSNIFMMLQTVLTYKVYNPEKFKAQYEAEVAAKRAAKKEIKTVTVEEGGKKVEKNGNKRQLDQMRLEYARKLDAEKYANDRTVPLTDEQRAEMEAQKAQKGKKKK